MRESEQAVSVETTGRKLNPIGVWFDQVKKSRGLNWDQMDSIFGLSARKLRVREPESVSIYALQTVLVGSAGINCSGDETDGLGAAVSSIIQEIWDKKGKLYTRTPPIVPKTVVKSFSCELFTDLAFARTLSPGLDESEINLRAKRIGHARRMLGLPAVFSPNEAEEIQSLIQRKAEEKDQEKNAAIKSSFAKDLKDDLDISIPIGSGANPWVRKEDGFPTPKQFGVILEEGNFSDEIRESVVTRWINEFRERIPITGIMLSKELGISREMLRLMARKVNPEGNFSNWETIEKIREHYRKYPKRR